MSAQDAEKKKLLKHLNGFCLEMGENFDTLNASLRGRIEDSIQSLSAPRNIAIAGLADAKHHDLASFFLGIDLVSTNVAMDDCPIIHIRHGAAERTHAHVGRQKRVLPGRKIDDVIAIGKIDKVELELTAPITAEMNFTIMPVYDDEESRPRYPFELLNDADVLIWCSSADKPWQPHESRFWHTIPDELKARSILALTGAERIDGDAAQTIVTEKQAQLSDEFRATALISIGGAKKAAPNGHLVDPAGFKNSGGHKMLQSLMSVLSVSNQSALERARAVQLELETTPLGDMQAAPENPVAAPLTKFIVPQKPKAAESKPEVSTKAILSKHIAICIKSVKAVDNGDYADLFERLESLLTELLRDETGDLKKITDSAAIRSELTEARDLISLLRYEGDQKAAHDSATIVRQICTDFWNSLKACDHGDAQVGTVTRKAS